jgi:DNA-binding MarR family transcriptional regulator
MIERVEDQKDRRVRRLVLSPTGSKLLDERHEHRAKIAQTLLEELSDEDRELVFSGLDMLVSAARALQPCREPDSHSVSAELRHETQGVENQR